MLSQYIISDDFTDSWSAELSRRFRWLESSWFRLIFAFFDTVVAAGAVGSCCLICDRHPEWVVAVAS